MNTPSVQNDNLGARKRKAPAADPLNSEIERLAAAAARKRARNAASGALGLAPKTKVTQKNIQQDNEIATISSTSGPTTTKTVPPTTAKPLANQNGSGQLELEASVASEVDDNDDDHDTLPVASYRRAPKKPNRIIELESLDDGSDDEDDVEEVDPRPIKTKKTARQSNTKKQPEKGKKDVLEILTDSESPEEESAEVELGEILNPFLGIYKINLFNTRTPQKRLERSYLCLLRANTGYCLY
jgi:hypothetical protein